MGKKFTIYGQAQKGRSYFVFIGKTVRLANGNEGIVRKQHNNTIRIEVTKGNYSLTDYYIKDISGILE